jgi:anti-repressor protein
MNDTNQPMSLIPVIDGFIGEEEQPCVDARTLHQWLKNGDRFATWIKSRIKTYGFIQNEDFACLSVISETQRLNGQKGKAKRIDYLLTLNCEKTLRKTVFGLMDQFNKASLEFDKFCEIASHAGRTLSLVGKQYKPQAKSKLDELKNKVQPHLTHLEIQ